jgi:hypothetical protein
MKCGGTSVRIGLTEGVVGAREGPGIFELNGDAAKVAAGGRNPENWAFRDALLPYVLLAEKPSVVLGHFRYRDRYDDLLGAAHFVTVLRDPVERLVSLYKYRRYKDGIDVAVELSFEEFVATPRWAKEGHAYVDLFCGGDDFNPRSDEAVDAAVENLSKFAVVGFTADLDQFSTDVGACIEKPMSIGTYNRSPAPEDIQLDGALREQVRAVCAPDYAVYERVLAARATPC